MYTREKRVCRHHGETTYSIDGGGIWRCVKCGTERVNKRRKNIKHRLIQVLGGKCMRCGYDKCEDALEFHHRDSSEKEFTISARHCSYENKLKEALKCDLLCSNCHKEVHCLTIAP